MLGGADAVGCGLLLQELVLEHLDELKKIVSFSKYDRTCGVSVTKELAEEERPED